MQHADKGSNESANFVVIFSESGFLHDSKITNVCQNKSLYP